MQIHSSNLELNLSQVKEMKFSSLASSQNECIQVHQQVDVEAEHKKFKETESYRPCFQLIITANDNVTMPEELKNIVGLVQQKDFEKFFGEIVTRDRNIAQLAYRIIPMTLFC